MKEDRSVLSLFVKGAFFLAGLFLLLCVLASKISGVSIVSEEIMKGLETILIIALCIFGFLVLGLLTAGILSGKKEDPYSSKSQSILIKDGTLRYEKKDEKGKKKKVSIDLSKIDAYLNEYGQLYMVGDTKLHKKDKNARPNANTLYIQFSDGRDMSLRELNDTDPDLYNEVCAFLDRIKDMDTVELSFRGRRYVNEEDLKIAGRNNVSKMKDAAKKIRDPQVKEEIRKTVSVIEDFEPDIYGNSDKVRKLYDHYLPMMNGIIEDYAVMEGHDESIVDLSESKKRLIDTLQLIDAAFESFKKGDEADGFDELEADVEDLNAVLEKKEM